ncbi:hypothetical protein FQN57_006520 [Myotisia sp. PD_48]|nr:hypothetical protein FQN57_006520 [Myotisia sp. PD_48]
MEYFDFDQAAQQNDLNSDQFNAGSLDQISRCSSPIPHAINEDVLPTPSCADQLPDPKTFRHESQYPMTPAKEPCYFCRFMELDCFLAQRGVLQNDSRCTCCIALGRQCSVTLDQSHGRFVDTLHSVSEDAYVPTWGLKGKRALKSSTGAGKFPYEEPDQKQRKSGARFPTRAVKTLKTWLLEHSSNPYPTDEEKDDLKLKTGLKRSQICSWLANARRRGKIRQPSPGVGTFPGGIPIPGKQLPPGVDISELNPLDRWRHSPPEHEAASARDIIQAMATSSFNPDQTKPQFKAPASISRRGGSSNDDSGSKLTSQSVSSLETNKSSISDMSFASVFSHRSRGSWNTDLKERRRRRHKPAAAPNPFQKSRAARIFQCTFCTDSFPTKYDWQRHEKSLHLALDKWTCAPHGGIEMTDTGQSVCAFCRHPNPDEEHLETHNYSTCEEKSIQERTFYRKDHLNQHLRLMHSVKLGPWMDSWKTTTTEIKSRCGFCDMTFTTWKDRVDHLAAHFKSGVEMTQWKGEWGFEPHITSRVENGMPPYLIAQDRNTLDPFLARPKSTGYDNVPELGVGGSTESWASIPVPMDASCFRRLETELTTYIARLVSQDTVPTDKMLQSKARLVIYGNDDPWNQTCADNPTWLNILKRDAGLCELPNAPDMHLEDLEMQPPFAAAGGLRQPPAAKANGLSEGIVSPTLSDFHSAPASHRGSVSFSFAGSFDTPSRRRGAATSEPDDGGGGLGGMNFLPSSALHHSNIPRLSSSAPVSTAASEVDPLTALGFDEQFLRQLHSGYGDLGQMIDDIEFGTGEGNPGTNRNSFSGFTFGSNVFASTEGIFNSGGGGGFNPNNLSGPSSAPITPFSGIRALPTDGVGAAAAALGSTTFEGVYPQNAFDFSSAMDIQQDNSGNFDQHQHQQHFG